MEVRVRGDRRATGRTLLVLFLGLALLGLGLAPVASGAATFYARGGGGNTKPAVRRATNATCRKPSKKRMPPGPKLGRPGPRA